jgi:hypothetical protein
MFSLHNRGELPAVTEHEFENLNSRLKGLWLAEHNEDGSHIEEIARIDTSNTFTEEQIISHGNLLFPHDDVFTRYGSTFLSDNAFFSALLGGWQLDDTEENAVIQTFGYDEGINFYTVEAGANPRTPTQVLGIDFDNVVQLYQGQLKFPATQNPSTDSNTLDDYEEGLFTPTIGGSDSESGQVYSTQSGSYIKIGKMVHVSGTIVLTTLGTINGVVQIKGLPFTCDSPTGARTSGSIIWANTTTGFVSMNLAILESTAYAFLFAAVSATTGMGALSQVDLANNTAFTFSITYRTNS